MPPTRTLVNAVDFFPKTVNLAGTEARGLSRLAQGLVGSEILRIAAEIRTLSSAGKAICNLTVGDFSSSEFRIPPSLESGVARALAEGHSNYPPSDGIPELRKEVARFYERELGLSYPVESILIAGGARPLIYATFKAIIDHGDRVLYPTPSWNNNHYAYLTGAQGVELVVGAGTNFLPTASAIRALLDPKVRLICINTPLNPTGTVLSEREVGAIAELVVEENEQRQREGKPSLYLMWDQVYWMLTFGDVRHHTPPELVPEAAAWTIFIDGISKAFSATGLRVGWTVAPPYVAARMRDILGHVGAWAPRAEQVATARLLADEGAIASYHETMIRGLQLRLDLLHDSFQKMKSEGLRVDSIPPQGAIYLSARFDLIGRSFNKTAIRSNEEIRKLLLEHAGFGVVPFQAFGLKEENGWMRLSVGAASPAEIESGLARVRTFLEKIS